MNRISAKKTALLGMLIALAFIFSYLERMIPFIFPFPGMKLGLANIIVLTALYILGTKEAFALTVVRVILAGFTFGNLYSIWYGLAGAVLSLLFMILFKKINKFSIIGVSIIGGVAHNIGQIIVAVLVLGRAVIYYLPFLFIGGIASGALIGVLGTLVVNALKNIMKINSGK